MKNEIAIDLTLEEMEILLKSLRMYIAFSPANHDELIEKLAATKGQLQRLMHNHD